MKQKFISQTPPLKDLNLSVINGSLLQGTGCGDSIFQMDDQTFLDQLDSLDERMSQTLRFLGDELDKVIDKNTLSSQPHPNNMIQYRYKTLISFSDYMNKQISVIIKSSSNKFYLVKLPKYFMCPLCLEPFQKPVTLPCSHVFCAFCLHRCGQLWSRMRCPACYKAYEQYPKVNLLIEKDLNALLKRSVSPQLNQFVLVLSPYGNIPAFCIGVVVELVSGFVSRDMESVIIQDFGPNDSQDDHINLKTMVAKVNVGGEIWIGKAADLYVIDNSYFPIATRPLRGSLVLDYKSVKQVSDPIFIGEALQVRDSEVLQSANMSLQQSELCDRSLRTVQQAPQLSVIPEGQVVSFVKIKGSQSNFNAIQEAERRGAKSFTEVEVCCSKFGGKEADDGILSDSGEVPSLLESNYLMPKKLASEIQPEYKIREFVYDPIAPKQQQTFVQFAQIRKPEFCKLIKDEPVHRNCVTISNQLQLTTYESSHNMLRLCTDFQFVQKFPQFSCSGCKMLLRLPVLTLCNCNYCFNCIRQLYELKLPCLGCGARIDRPYTLSSLNKKLILKMYAKCPRHSPMVDAGVPVKVGEKFGVLIDDPNRVNLWVLFGMWQISYVYCNDLKAVNLTGLQTAIRADNGLVFYQKEFGFLEQIDGKYYFSGRSSTNGIELSTKQVIYDIQKVVDDIREQIIVAKMDGSKLLQEKEVAKIKLLKNKASTAYKAELMKQQQQSDQKAKKQNADQFQQQGKKNAVRNGNQSRADDKFQMEKEMRDRRKKLHLVAPDNPKAQFHPGNQMLFDYGKDEEAGKKKYIQLGSEEDKYLSREAQIQQRMRATKPYLIQLCYQLPYLNFICSACWNVLKKPLILNCGHIVCRNCACIYQVNGGKCGQCYQVTGNVGELPMEIHLYEKLLERMDANKYYRGLDVGCFVVQKGTTDIGIVKQILQEAVIVYPRQEVRVPYNELISCDPVQETEDDMELGDVVKIIDGNYLNMYGLIISFPDQRQFSIRQIKKQYQLDDDSIVLKIQLETGVPELLPVDYLRKMVLGVVIADIDTYQQREKSAEQMHEKQLFEGFMEELRNGVVFEEEKTQAQKQAIEEQQFEENAPRRNIWDGENAVRRGGYRK